MANYVWPPALPQVPQRGFSESVGANIIRTPTDQGPAKQRRRSLRPSIMGVSFLMTTAQVAILQDFLYDTLQCVKAFDFTHPRTGYTVNTRVVPGQDGELFKSTYAAPGYWTITLNFEILPTFVTLSPGSYNIPINRISQFSRTTTATYIDESGVLQTAPANVARYQGGQLLVEDGATNLLPAPEEFDSATWVKQATTVTPGLWEPAPNGVHYVADAVFETAATAQHDIYATGALAQGKSFSVFVKPVGRRYIGLYGYAGGIVCGQTFDLVAGVVGSPWTGVAPVATIIQAFAGGWWRIGMTSQVLMDIGAVIFCESNASGVPVYAGNPAAGAYLWGAMMNTSGLSSYTLATRAADLAIISAT